MSIQSFCSWMDATHRKSHQVKCRLIWKRSTQKATTCGNMVFVVDENHLRVQAHSIDKSKTNEDTSKKLNESWGKLITCAIDPITIIGTWVIIQQTCLKPFSSHSPVNSHVSDKKRANNLSESRDQLEVHCRGFMYIKINGCTYNKPNKK